MTTLYERPRQKIQQQFISGSSNIFTPTLYATIVGPVYEMVEDEDQGVYFGDEKEYFFNSVHKADIRTSDPNETLYPVTVKFNNANVLYASGVENAELTGLDFTCDGDRPFNFAIVSGERAYVRLDEGTYLHNFLSPQGTVTLTNESGSTYRLSSTVPIFYEEDVGGKIDYHDGGGNLLKDKDILSVATDCKSVTFTDTTSPTTAGTSAKAVLIKRDTLVASDKELRRVRRIIDDGSVSLYSGREYATYAISKYSVIRTMELSLGIVDLIALGATFTQDGFTLPADLTDSAGNAISDAELTVSYRALRGDKFETLASYASVTELAEDYNVNKYNTAVWMVYLALEQSGGNSVQLSPVASDHYYTDHARAYVDVFDFIKEQESPFGIVPASADPDVVSALANHVTAASSEDWTNFRRGYVTHKLETMETVVDVPNTGDGYVEGHREGFTGKYLYDSGSEFITAGVNAGHYVEIASWTAIEPALIVAGTASLIEASDWATAYTKVTITGLAGAENVVSGMTVKFTGVSATVYTDHTRSGEPISTGQTYGDLGYRIISASVGSGVLTLYIYTKGTAEASPAGSTAVSVFDGPLSFRDEKTILGRTVLISSVDTENKLTASFSPGWTGTYTGLRYRVINAYSKSEQAERYAAYAEGFSDRRMSILYPDTFQDVDGEVWPSYYICAARAGWRSGHPAHEPMTNAYLTNSFFHKLIRTDRDKYFRDSHLDTMAAGGVEIYIQNSSGSAIKCRHQLTTDRSSIQTQEETSTCSVDTACKMLKQVIKPLIGRYNIGPDLFSVLNTRIAGVRELVTERPIANFGSILKSFEISTLAQDPNNADGLILEIDSVTQKPFNRIHTIMRIK